MGKEQFLSIRETDWEQMEYSSGGVSCRIAHIAGGIETPEFLKELRRISCEFSIAVFTKENRNRLLSSDESPNTVQSQESLPVLQLTSGYGKKIIKIFFKKNY